MPTTRLALGEVGKVGVAISSLADMETLLDQIPLNKVSVSMTINAPAAILLRWSSPWARSRVCRPASCAARSRTTSSRNTWRAAPTSFRRGPRMRLITDVFRYCAKEVPNWNTISISGYHIREAGSTAVQEVAFTLADGIEYVKAAIEARGWTWTTSRRSSASSSTPTTTSWRRWPSSAPPAGCGRGSCASASAPKSRLRCNCASTPRPAAAR